MWLTSKDIRDLFIVAGSVVAATLGIAFLLGYLAGCGSNTSGYYEVRRSVPGYCFKAEGLSKERCYKEKETCQHKVSLLRDHHPWARIDQECVLKAK
jgi:hypothetical protein